MSGSPALQVLLSRSALTRNAGVLLDRGARVFDLRHDAYAHGLAEVADILAHAGVSTVRVDAGADAAPLAARGMTAEKETEPDATAGELFGIPAGDACATEPVMRLQGRVLSTKPLHAGEAVSYGYTHRAERDTRVALVSGGYAQGILRALGNRIRVQVGAHLRPVVGRIAMDVCVVDLEGTDAEVGSPVTFFGGTDGARTSLSDWAQHTGMSAMEIAVVVGRHVERRWDA